ncbi:hypothetical protein ACTFIT_005274 [Dictyostelium discoideum]
MEKETPQQETKQSTNKESGFFDEIIKRTNQLLEKEKELHEKYNKEITSQQDQIDQLKKKISEIHLTFSQQKDILYNDFKRSIKILKKQTGIPLNQEKDKGNENENEEEKTKID